jgi:hypothetical protein
MQALLGFHNESRWIRYARKSIIHLFPYLPKQPGYNKRLRSLSTQLAHFIAVLVTDTDLWQHPIRIADSTPVPCGTSRETALRSDLAGWAGYGYCAAHSRLFWGLRLHHVGGVSEPGESRTRWRPCARSSGERHRSSLPRSVYLIRKLRRLPRPCSMRAPWERRDSKAIFAAGSDAPRLPR